MDFSIIICTYNRAEQVSGLVRQIMYQDISNSCEWQIVVVDNNSSDSTAERIKPLIDESNGTVSYVLESRQGKSHALNRGIEESTGDVLIFADDDITPATGWLRAYTEVFKDATIDGVGGRILPLFECSLPEWFDPQASFPFKFDLGERKIRLCAPPFGANMAFRRSMFEKYGLFRTDLGPNEGAGSGLGEDSEFGLRLLREGRELIYCPEAAVSHPVTSEQLSRPFLIDWHKRYGQSMVERGQIPGLRSGGAGVPRFMYRKLVEDIMKWLFTFDQRRRFYKRLSVASTLGTVAQLRKRAGASDSSEGTD